MAPKSSRNVTWKTVTFEDVPNLTHSEMLALSEARKREKLFSRADSPPRTRAQHSSDPPGASPSPIQSSGSLGAVRNSRTSSQKPPSPYTRIERNPKSLNVDRYKRVGRNAPVQTKKTINEPSPPSSPEPEEGTGRRVTATLDSVKDTIEMMRASQRSIDLLEKENEEAIQKATEMREIANGLQQQLAAERSRTERLLTYLNTWQRNSRHWVYDSVFPKRDVILMTKTDANANTSETLEVDREDADNNTELEKFLQESSETPGNVEEAVLELTPPDVVTYLGKVKIPGNSETVAEPVTPPKDKGKGKEVLNNPPAPDSNGKRKRGWTEQQGAEALDVLNKIKFRQQVEASRRSRLDQDTHLNTSGTSGIGSLGGLREPLHKRRKVVPRNDGHHPAEDTEGSRFHETLSKGSPCDVAGGESKTNDPRLTTTTNSPSALGKSKLRPSAGSRPSYTPEDIFQDSGSGSAGHPTSSGPMPKNESRGLTRMGSMILVEKGGTLVPSNNQPMLKQSLYDFVYGVKRTIATPPPLPASLSWTSTGFPVIVLPNRESVPLREHITGIRRAVQFIQAGPPPGVKRSTVNPNRALRRSHYPAFRWNFDGTPDIDIPKSTDPEQENKLFAAVKFLGDWAPWNKAPSTADVIPSESGAFHGLEHNSSAARTLHLEGLLCSWTTGGLPVITFLPDLSAEDQYHENILQASNFILRGPGPDENWDPSGELPATFRGRLPLDPMVVCTTDEFESPRVKLPTPSCPSYYDRIVISARFIRNVMAASAAKKDAMARIDAKARATAEELARDLAREDEDEDSSVTVEGSQERIEGQVVQHQIEEREDAIHESGTRTIKDRLNEDAEEEPVAKVARKATRKATRKSTRKNTRKAGKKA